ncbi:Hypothetical protein D9617_2g059910 [Elsinoe fawcettii]|nr:Hypothetical protein D9617_2g059910 [Elsinoe fawcettii]
MPPKKLSDEAVIALATLVIMVTFGPVGWILSRWFASRARLGIYQTDVERQCDREWRVLAGLYRIWARSGPGWEELDEELSTSSSRTRATADSSTLQNRNNTVHAPASISPGWTKEASIALAGLLFTILTALGWALTKMYTRRIRTEEYHHWRRQDAELLAALLRPQQHLNSVDMGDECHVEEEAASPSNSEIPIVHDAAD